MTSLRQMLLGRRLANRESEERKIGALEAIPAMGLDGLGSSAYGPEAALAVLAVLSASYWQTIRAYPSSGGAYTVARENLGSSAGLLAVASLMTDYMLNVAVGISAGVAALVSAVPALHPHTLSLCLGVLAFVTLMNLRGTLDAGRLFAVPTYLFLASFGLILAIGVVRTVAAGGHPQPVVPPPALPPATEAVSLWLLLRAFASGCTAMTGVEVFSIGILYLAAVASLLLVVFGGITEHLIPLFTVGAFLTFTLSQAGMVMHWRRALQDEEAGGEARRRLRLQLAVNAVGAVTTGVALVVIVLAKFMAGAWIVVLVVPAVIVLLRAIRRYYVELERKVHDPTPLDLQDLATPIVLVAIEEWNQMADRALTFALSLSPHVIGLHLADLGGSRLTVINLPWYLEGRELPAVAQRAA